MFLLFFFSVLFSASLAFCPAFLTASWSLCAYIRIVTSGLLCPALRLTAGMSAPFFIASVKLVWRNLCGWKLLIKMKGLFDVHNYGWDTIWGDKDCIPGDVTRKTQPNQIAYPLTLPYGIEYNCIMKN